LANSAFACRDLPAASDNGAPGIGSLAGCKFGGFVRQRGNAILRAASGLAALFRLALSPRRRQACALWRSASRAFRCVLAAGRRALRASAFAASALPAGPVPSTFLCRGFDASCSILFGHLLFVERRPQRTVYMRRSTTYFPASRAASMLSKRSWPIFAGPYPFAAAASGLRRRAHLLSLSLFDHLHGFCQLFELCWANRPVAAVAASSACFRCGQFVELFCRQPVTVGDRVAASARNLAAD